MLRQGHSPSRHSYAVPPSPYTGEATATVAFGRSRGSSGDNRRAGACLPPSPIKVVSFGRIAIALIGFGVAHLRPQKKGCFCIPALLLCCRFAFGVCRRRAPPSGTSSRGGSALGRLNPPLAAGSALPISDHEKRDAEASLFSWCERRDLNPYG